MTCLKSPWGPLGSPLANTTVFSFCLRNNLTSSLKLISLSLHQLHSDTMPSNTTLQLSLSDPPSQSVITESYSFLYSTVFSYSGMWTVFFVLLNSGLTLFLLSSRSSDRMLRWTGESIPVAGLLPLSPRQHDRGALWWARRFGSRLGGRRPVHGQRRWPRLGRGVPASAAAIDGSRPPAGGALHGHSGHDEAASTEPRGCASRNPALVFLRSATDGQTALGPTQHLQGLRGAGHPQPAAARARAGHSNRTCARSLWVGGRGCTASRAHTGGELIPPTWHTSCLAV